MQVVEVADTGMKNMVVPDIQTYLCHSDDETRATMHCGVGTHSFQRSWCI